ncbi:unnamed protein product [Orchesella dallaii]|uniref:Uncharacterized protein n=1 Tax=Orchesella dallaii TaxID=48710 RepID=A0ABP1S425_9HEXA
MRSDDESTAVAETLPSVLERRNLSEAESGKIEHDNFSTSRQRGNQENPRPTPSSSTTKIPKLFTAVFIIITVVLGLIQVRIEKELKGLQGDLKDCNIQTQNFSIQIQNLHGQLLSRNEEVDQLKVKLTRQNSEIDQLKVKLTSQNSEIDQLNVKLSSQNSEIDQLNVKLTSKNSEIDQLKVKLTSKISEIDQLNSQVDQLHSQIKHLNADIASTKSLKLNRSNAEIIFSKFHEFDNSNTQLKNTYVEYVNDVKFIVTPCLFYVGGFATNYFARKIHEIMIKYVELRDRSQ